MVSILLDKMNTCVSVIATDGDDDTMELLRENIRFTGKSASYLFLSYPILSYIVLYYTILYYTILYYTILD